MIKVISVSVITYTDNEGRFRYMDSGTIFDVIPIAKGTTYKYDGKTRVIKKDSFMGILDGYSFDVDKKEFKTID